MWNKDFSILMLNIFKIKCGNVAITSSNQTSLRIKKNWLHIENWLIETLIDQYRVRFKEIHRWILLNLPFKKKNDFD